MCRDHNREQAHRRIRQDAGLCLQPRRHQHDALREELAKQDVPSLSTLEALNKLFELAEKAKKK
jgi:hypothetical protein